MTRLRRTLVAVALAVGLCATAVEPALAAPAAGGATYKVQPGDSLFGIAFKLNVRVSELLSVNKLVLTSLILPGEVLAVPATARSIAGAPAVGVTPSTVAPAPQVYVVVKNDYLTGIASRMNVPVRALLTTNHLQLNSLIWPGMRLLVPAGGKLPAAKPAVQKSSGKATAVTSPSSTVPAARATPPYIIVRGDSLSGIANKLGVTLQSLLAVNQLSVSSAIYPAMTLVVPAGGKLPVAHPVVSAAGKSAAVPAKVATVLAFVRAQLGKPYQAFMAGPNSYDCSGLTLAGYRQIGIFLPHYSGAQIAFGTAIDWTTQPIRAGDLIFMETAAGSGIIGHVGIATSATTWIQAPRTGDVVREGNIPMSRVAGVRRLVNG